MADTQIDELRLDITVEDKTSGESSDKKVKNLATAISRLNKNLQSFDNAKFTKVFENMSKGLDPFVKKIEKVSNALASLATIVSKGGLDKAVKEVSGKVPELKTETVSDNGKKAEPVKAIQGKAESLDIENKLRILNALLIEMQKIQKEASVSADKFFGKLMNKSEKTELRILNLKQQISKLKESLGTQKEQYISTLMNGGDVTGIQEKARKTSSEMHKLQKQLDKLNGTVTKTKRPLGQLLKSFGRIAMYRAVRRTIQEITQAFMESIDEIAKYNSEFRDTMGGLQSSMAKAKASIGVAFYQVLILLEPVITQIANGVANLANSLSKVTANMRGVANYTKINTEYMKEYQSATQGTLLAFDTFTTLNAGQGTDYSKMFETGEDALDESQFTGTETALKNIFELIQTIGVSIKNVWNGGLKDVLSTILDLTIKITNWFADAISTIANIDIGNISLLEAALWGIVGVLAAIVIKNLAVLASSPITWIVVGIAGVIAALSVLVKNWDTIVKFFESTCKKIGEFFTSLWHGIANGFAKIINGIVNTFVAWVNILIDGVNALLKPINKVGKAVGASENFAQIPHWDYKMNWKPYANGGMFEGAGTMYTLAGENGAEIVAQGSQGTGVANVEQIAEAEYRGTLRALYEYGAAQNGGMAINLDMNKLGTAVASNVGFRNEANRRNAGLNWK